MASDAGALATSRAACRSIRCAAARRCSDDARSVRSAALWVANEATSSARVTSRCTSAAVCDTFCSLLVECDAGTPGDRGRRPTQRRQRGAHSLDEMTRARRRRLQHRVGDEIGDRPIDLVPDSRDHGHRHRRDRAGDRLRRRTPPARCGCRHRARSRSRRSSSGRARSVRARPSRRPRRPALGCRRRALATRSHSSRARA